MDQRDPLARSDGEQDGVITGAEAVAYVKEVMPELHCIGCGSRSFDLFSDDDFAAPTHMMSTGQRYSAAAALSCERCGLIYTVVWAKIRDWIEARKKNAAT
jgi:hypothetical protein